MKVGIWRQSIIVVIILGILFIFLGFFDWSVLNIILLLRILVHPKEPINRI